MSDPSSSFVCLLNSCSHPDASNTTEGARAAEGEAGMDARYPDEIQRMALGGPKADPGAGPSQESKSPGVDWFKATLLVF